jgi:hypothetical protein
MANGASTNYIILADGVSVSATGVVGVAQHSLEAHADEIGIIVQIDSGTVSALTLNLQHKVGGTWTNVAGAQTTATSGGAVAFATTPIAGQIRINAATVTTPSSLVVTVKLCYGKKK